MHNASKSHKQNIVLNNNIETMKESIQLLSYNLRKLLICNIISKSILFISYQIITYLMV